MIITRLFGGLGNQMFQYSVGRSLTLKLGVPLKVDTSDFAEYPLRRYSLNHFNIKAEIASPAEVKQLRGDRHPKASRSFFGLLKTSQSTLPDSYMKEKIEFEFDPGIIQLSDNHYLDGYWQTEKYFSNIETTIRTDFEFVDPQDNANSAMSECIASYDAISVHIRRGDYVHNANTNAFHGTMSLGYYIRAATKMLEGVRNPAFFVFSDDHQWIKENIKLPAKTFYVDINGPEKDYADLRLLSQCQHHIIANSSFSWWGAWLCTNPGKKVIAPLRWFNADKATKDLIPSTWQRI